MFVNVDMCKTVLNAGENTDSPAIFTELLRSANNYFQDALGCMSGDVSGAQLAGRMGGLPNVNELKLT